MLTKQDCDNLLNIIANTNIPGSSAQAVYELQCKLNAIKESIDNPILPKEKKEKSPS